MSETASSDGETRRVHISQPERYWMATAELFRGMADPDVDDGHQRWADRDDIRWDELERMITEVSLALAERSYIEYQRLEDAVEISTTAPAGGLKVSETKILKSWFTFAEAPCGDLWEDHLINGRHRLWNVWKHAPAAVLPIRSDVLDDTDDVDTMGERFAAMIRNTATAGLNELSTEVITRSPLYVAALTQATTITVD